MKLLKNTHGWAAFTRLELCVVIGMIGVLTSLLLPALAREQNRDWRAVCLRHLSQLADAMAMYAADNGDYLPPNPDDESTEKGHAWCPGGAGIHEANEFNSDLLKDGSRTLIAPFINRDASVLKCPADARTGPYKGTASVDFNKIGMIVPAARTVSLNGAVGTVPKRKLPNYGAWLTGTYLAAPNTNYYTYGKMSAFLKPGPAKTFTFIEENPYSLNDCVLGCMGPTDGSVPQKMIDWPSTLHLMAGGVAFADGHAEMHPWQDNRTYLNQPAMTATQNGSPDIQWLADHASARTSP